MKAPARAALILDKGPIMFEAFPARMRWKRFKLIVSRAGEGNVSSNQRAAPEWSKNQEGAGHCLKSRKPT